MGAGASTAIPEHLDKEAAQQLAGDNFNAAQFDKVANAEGKVTRADFLNADRAFADGIVAALSAARVDPAALAVSIKKRLPHFKGKDYYPPERGGKVAVASKEGRKAIDEVLAFLAKQPPLGPLTAHPDALADESLRLSCEDHLVDRGTLGVVGHTGSDGSHPLDRVNRYGHLGAGFAGECLWYGRRGATAQQMVEDLVIDDGVATRGHRMCIFDEHYAHAAAKYGAHAVFGAMAVMEFVSADSFVSGGEEVIKKRQLDGAPKPVPPPEKKAEDETQWKLGCCVGCGEPIRGGAVMEIEKLGKYHKDCFKCVGCEKPLVGVPWRPTPKEQATNGKIEPWCEACHTSNFAPRCGGCGECITGPYIKINGAPFHKACKPKAEAAAAGAAGPSGATKVTKTTKAKATKTAAAPAAPKGKASMPGSRTGVGGLIADYGDLGI